MRQTISGLVAALAMVTASAAPAMACGGGLFGSSCSPCSGYVSPCGQGYGYGYGASYAGYGYGNAGFERLPELSPQYYYVNQGPTYGGPGNLAPLPTYQESAVSGWNAYSRPYYYGYDGGPYGNATNHYYDGASVQGPAIYSYRPRAYGRSWGVRTNYGYGVHRSYRYGYRHGYAPRYGMGYGGHRYAAPHHYGQRPLRRYY
jgi:hypothetical protein